MSYTVATNNATVHVQRCKAKNAYTFLSGIVVTCAVGCEIEIESNRMQLVTQQGLNSKVETRDGSAES